MNSDISKVVVGFDSVKGDAEPCFLLEHGTKRYVTLAVMEFDPNDTSLDEEARAKIDEMEAMLAGKHTVSGVVYGPPTKMMSLAQSESRNLI